MKTIKIPGILQELFGEEITIPELILTLFSGLAISALLLAITFEEWQGIALWRQVLLLIFTIDISGGVVANFSCSTNQYYKKDTKARLKFILIHVQPVILAFLMDNAYTISIAVTAYTILTALIVNALIKHPAQRIIGTAFMFFGVTTFLLLTHQIPIVLMTLFAMYMFKVIYAFSVDHYAKREV